ncbi:bacterio-opsin activator domain-containing protein [Natronococcus wangiae]|uniref:bacterio-opsin activator domain-containing protein n=1 Tax=Natronococcus wangiae TaxID=3068275 RepID=UPI00273FC641|nr:bacterio-opsin activator domain-containing protein [Natronococcus sp. AD5]
MVESITVLVVDNEPGYAELVGAMLERERESIVAVAATDAAEALGIRAKRDVDCIVSDYEMPEMTGFELLERVREREPKLPFVLFTGRGSEELASEAIAAGVTQYLQKGNGTEQYALLANQITNAVSQYRAETELRESERRYERTLTTLHETTRDLMRAETKREIYRVATDTATEILDVQVVAAYAFEPADGVLEHAASTGASPAFGDPDVAIGRNDGLVWDVFSAGESAYYEDVMREDDVEAVQQLSRSELIVPLGTHGVLVVGSGAVDGFDETMIELVHVLGANAEAALDRAEREQLLREHDRTLARQNEELTRLNRVNEIVREINHGVAQATTRDAIETTICDRLAGTDRYRFAWIASSDAEPPEPTSWAGVDAAYIDRIRDDGDDAPEGRLVRETLDTERVCVVENVLEADGWDRRRTEALTYGYQTVLAVPLADDERRYGALLVHADGVNAIGDGEREVFAELGETIGHAIRSVERTRATRAGGTIELELACDNSRLLLNRLSERLEKPVSVAGVVERGADETIAFVSVPAGADLAALESEWASVERLSVISEGEDETLFELTVTSTPLLDVLRTYDVRVRAATSRAGTATITLEVPRRVGARSLIESIRDGFPGTELEARRETTSTPARRFDTQLEERLTDKQFQALQAAYYSGFFEWPRESTGEDLADALGVSPPTYHYHLRAAERKLVTLSFDGFSN